MYTDDCFYSVFERPPASTDRIDRFAEVIVDAARRNNCSIRLYFLANMVGHRAQQQIILREVDRQQPTRFNAKLLVGKVAEKRVDTYASLCRKDFGTFSASTLSVACKHDVEKNSLEHRMLNSEITAGRFITDWKITHGGPVHPALYAEKETSLDPAWLATEPSYDKVVIQPYLARRCGSGLVQSHRFAVIQTIAQFKKHKAAAVLAFRTREAVMGKATQEVLRLLGHASGDFEIENEPVTDTLDYWTKLGLAIQHYNCLRFYRGEPSLLNV